MMTDKPIPFHFGPQLMAYFKANTGLLSRMQSSLLLRVFWREGGDDFFKARIAAERVPKWT